MNKTINNQKLKTNKIVSGGQTGADRAAFDFALENGFEIGGFVPKGRIAEDGRISGKYPNLIETETADYAERTELNVINSDATIIFSHGKLTGGSLLTEQLTQKHQKPFLFINLIENHSEIILKKAKEFLQMNNYKILNIAGSRASEDDEIYRKTKIFLTNLFD